MNIAETLELLAKKGWIQEIEIPTILEDEDFQKLSTKKGSKKNTTEEKNFIDGEYKDMDDEK